MITIRPDTASMQKSTWHWNAQFQRFRIRKKLPRTLFRHTCFVISKPQTSAHIISSMALPRDGLKYDDSHNVRSARSTKLPSITSISQLKQRLEKQRLEKLRRRYRHAKLPTNGRSRHQESRQQESRRQESKHQESRFSRSKLSRSKFSNSKFSNSKFSRSKFSNPVSPKKSLQSLTRKYRSSPRVFEVRRRNQKTTPFYNRRIQLSERRMKNKRKRKIPTLETFIVADRKMLDRHTTDNVTDYILTIMNIVAQLYQNPELKSSKTAVRIIVAGVMLLEVDEPGLKIEHSARRTLRSFCKWQDGTIRVAGRRPDHSILLTGEDICSRRNRPCDTLGYSFVKGMCERRHSCTVNEDSVGLGVAYRRVLRIFYSGSEIGYNKRILRAVLGRNWSKWVKVVEIFQNCSELVKLD